MSEFWDKVQASRQARLEYEAEIGITPPEPQPAPKPEPVRRTNHHNPNPPKLTPEQDQEARRRYDEGESSPQIAADMGVTPFVLRQGIIRAGGTLRPKGESLHLRFAISSEQLDVIAAEYAAGKAMRHLARDHDVSEHSIKRALVARGVTLRTQSEASQLREGRRHDRPVRSDSEQRADLVELYRADVNVLMGGPGSETEVIACRPADDRADRYQDDWAKACRCYRCGCLLTATTVIIDRQHNPRLVRPVCEECKS